MSNISEAPRQHIQRANRDAPLRTCAELGVCQNLATPCLLCNDPKADPWPPEQDSLTPIERIGIWVTCAVLTTITLAVVVGGTSYAYFRWVAP